MYACSSENGNNNPDLAGVITKALVLQCERIDYTGCKTRWNSALGTNCWRVLALYFKPYIWFACWSLSTELHLEHAQGLRICPTSSRHRRVIHDHRLQSPTHGTVNVPRIVSVLNCVAPNASLLSYVRFNVSVLRYVAVHVS